MDLVSFVEKIGRGARNKVVHPDLWQETKENVRSYLNGLWDSDGWYKTETKTYKLTTTSRELAIGVQQLIVSLYSRPVRMEYTERPKTTTIEGRTVNQSDTYTIEYKLDTRKQDKAFFDNNHAWIPAKRNVATENKRTVYNLEVEIDNSYTANNVVVHNCQGFSLSGKGLAFDDPRSKLYFEYERLLNEVSPKYWLLENVPMKMEHQNVISSRLGVSPITINSSLVSAQSRKRLYWTNIAGVGQPENKKIYLKDIIESVNPDSIKSYCIDANYFKGGNLKQYIEKSRRQIVFDSPIQVGHIN